MHETIALCFGEVLQNAGPGVKQVVDRFLTKAGISELDISTRFGDVERVVTGVFGAGGKIMIVSTLSKVCDEYSLSLNVSYATSLHDRLEQLVPKHYRRAVETTTFEDKAGTHAPWTD